MVTGRWYVVRGKIVYRTEMGTKEGEDYLRHRHQVRKKIHNWQKKNHVAHPEKKLMLVVLVCTYNIKKIDFAHKAQPYLLTNGSHLWS